MTRAYQIRHQARRMRRYGMQPMVVMNTEDGFPDLAIVIIARWAWRYRSELAPTGLAAVVALTGWTLNATHRHAWPIIAALTATTAIALYGIGRKLGLATQAERAYAATVAATTGAWLAIADAVSPWRSPLPLTLAAGAWC
jgi:hypothetical protein